MLQYDEAPVTLDDRHGRLGRACFSSMDSNRGGVFADELENARREAADEDGRYVVCSAREVYF